MNVLITGAKGFIGKNLAETLKTKTAVSAVFEYDVDSSEEQLDSFCKQADFVFHFAGVNRPESDDEFRKQNVGFTKKLLDLLKKYQNKAPVLITSSIQSSLNNPYGQSKKEQEALVLDYGAAEHVRTCIYRLPNVFGKWSRPNYNSVVATFCYNIARDLPIHIDNPQTVLPLVYIDDVINAFVDNLFESDESDRADCKILESYSVSLQEIADLLYSFKNSRTNNFVPEQSSLFAKKLYATYLSYLPENGFSYFLNMHQDIRGSFTEFLKTDQNGQISINVIKPGVTKGNHWHHTKNEKFLAVSGDGVIKLRKIGDRQITKISISANSLCAVDIPTGYTHSIKNTGQQDLVVVIWASELYDEENPDTYYEEVSL